MNNPGIGSLVDFNIDGVLKQVQSEININGAIRADL